MKNIILSDSLSDVRERKAERISYVSILVGYGLFSIRAHRARTEAHRRREDGKEMVASFLCGQQKIKGALAPPAPPNPKV